MPPSTSPRKVVPLSTGEGPSHRPSFNNGPGLTKRVFFAGVVVEGSENGRRLPQDVQGLVLSLGEPIGEDAEEVVLAVRAHAAEGSGVDPARARGDASALIDIINELVTTERSYVKRLRILKEDYADPLRKFSRSKDTSILPAYQAKTLFGNIDNLLPVNDAFLTDLEKMQAPNGAKTVGGVGDVALKHFKDLRGFEHYRQYYVKREEAQSIFEREASKKSSGFSAFIDRIKYSSADVRSRVGLRELLMDPVQRIPRYTLLFRSMIKHMSIDDPQRAKLVEADSIASKIARAETDEQSKRAAIMYGFIATVDGFPPGLFSNARRFVDCIDVEDILTDAPAGANGPTVLHCTLFLFDDKLMIVKRPGNGERAGRVLAGLDEVEKVTKAGGMPIGMKKSGMVCKGVVDVTDVVATDVGGADLHLYLESPPTDQTERWSGRSFRSMSVVHPPAHINSDPTRTGADKKRFLENLWDVQASYRTKSGQSVVLAAEEREVESKHGRATLAKTYFNVYQRTAFLKEVKKTKVVVHIDALGTADPIPFGMDGPPYVIIRIQPMPGANLSRYSVKSSDVNDEGEEDVVHTARVPDRIVQTIHQFGLFKFRTGNLSAPSTPTASTRSRTAIFGLDAISRNLFNSRPGSRAGDFFGGSVNSHRRSKSASSRASTYTQTTVTNDGSLMKFSHRSNSTATTMSSMDDESVYDNKSPTRGSTRGRSPDFRRSMSESELDYSDVEDEEDGTIMHHMDDMDKSDSDLTMRLELARRNSQSQPAKPMPPLPNPFGEDVIYEEEPPEPIRPPSRASKDSSSHRSITPRPESSTPTKGLEYRSSRSSSEHTSERRPMGPRSVSPLPPMHRAASPLPPMLRATSPLPMHRTSSPFKQPQLPMPSMDVDMAMEALTSPQQPSTPTRTPSQLPRSKRQTFDTTPKPRASTSTDAQSTPSTVEPLSIKKKTSTRSSNGMSTPTTGRKNYTRNSPLSRATARIVSPRSSPQVRPGRSIVSLSHSSSLKGREASTEGLIQFAVTTREDIESSRRAVKRIKLEVEGLQAGTPQSSADESSAPSSPMKVAPLTPRRGMAPMTKAAQDRMEEMQLLIRRRGGEGTPRGRSRTLMSESGSGGSLNMDGMRAVHDLALDAERDLARAASSSDSMISEAKQLSFDFTERSAELEKAKLELQNSKRQCELVKSLLADATAEKEIMYEAFNEELDGMYNDANLPQDEAWQAMSQDLRTTKESRNELSKDNSNLKRRLAETEMQKEEWGALLRAHGLIP